ncbi:9125_t:CDS:2 [Paraglomus occultum]|uniref:9125_t:CDS:1 n=1 Tax=Paraglomus occultum TaxID=144539 RepID=A0A9N9EZM5_9GLOM|nr:9125_t:CDS:2 [Paraglomus occultum]
MAFFKVSRLLAILVVMFAALAVCSPIVNLSERQNTPVLHVPSPGPGPWAIESIQNVSWWCNECGQNDRVVIEIIKNGTTVVRRTTGHNANSGTKDFLIDPRWATVGDTFTVRVTDTRLHVSGTSGPFTVFKTQG